MDCPALNHRKRLFVDMDDIERVFHQAEKYGVHPVLKQEAPWKKTAARLHWLGHAPPRQLRVAQRQF